ncbi:hypothetical protein ACFWIB_14485 [Streptomyces sp. NPDC127051]|uniref:hypothetical protein n=1 Tax=Streptomyces sp. NPDC127051 TaxID=3347119 RepID=UPI003646EB11
MNDILNAAEQTDLAQFEGVIERGMNTFVEVGNALAAIQERKLYRSDHGTFEMYCRERWGFSRARAYQLTASAAAVSTIVDSGEVAPTNEGQARELARIPEMERAEVWRETVERTNGQPTAAAVRETYAARTAEVIDAEVVEDEDLLAGDDWQQPDGPGFEAAVTPPKVKRRPLPEAFADAGRDLTRAAEKLARLTEDDRFAKNRETTHHQVPELLGALEHTVRLVTAMNLPAADANEEARRWWATSLRNLSDALSGIASSLEKEI